MKQEQVEDYELTEKVVECAFSDLEHKLVARIRKTDAFIPELSLLAIDTKKKSRAYSIIQN